MTTKTEELIANLFAATSAKNERDLAITLGQHFTESSLPWSLTLREPNSTAILTPQQYLKSESAMALISVSNACYIWAPKDKVHIDMLMLE